MTFFARTPMVNRTSLWLIGLAMVFALATGTSNGAWAQSRPNYGGSPYPIWSPLSYFERSAIGDLHQAKNDDPDALLALYLVASGARQLSDFENARRRIGSFNQAMSKQIVNINNNQWLAGQTLNREMHKYFFLQESQGGAPNGYSLDQSRLQGIFETGQFNCISASLLYAVLARHLGLEVRGVILPSHAFIQLNLNDGRRIDVETTSPNGFDLVHDEEFYRRNNNDWFASRSLEPVTYEDYLQRERVPAWQLAARNMLNQHTRLEFMSAEDSYRLAEISAFMDPSYALAQEKRLHFYNQEIHHLLTEQDWDTLERLFFTTYEQVIAGSRLHRGHDSLQLALQSYLAGAMISYAQRGDIDRTLELIGEVLSFAQGNWEHQQTIEARVASAVSLLINRLVERKQFDEGVLVLTLVEAHLENPRAWPELLSWFYLRWAEHHWQDKNWARVVAVLDEYFLQPHRREEDKNPREALATAYNNWVIEHIHDRDWSGAETLLRDCRSKYPGGHTCGTAQKTLTEAQKRS